MKTFFVAILLGLSVISVSAAEKRRHLLLFVGEGNLERLNPEASVIRPLKKVKSLRGDTIQSLWHVQNYLPIASLDKDWKKAEGTKKKAQGIGKQYPMFLSRVRNATRNKKYDTVILYWCVGVSDARNGWGSEYAGSVKRVITRLRKDLDLGEIRVVMTGLTDSKVDLKKNPDWAVVRGAQEKLARTLKNSTLVKTDEFNGKKDSLYLTNDGYKALGEAYTKAALKVIDKASMKRPTGKTPSRPAVPRGY